jgi:hypothetical protein
MNFHIPVLSVRRVTTLVVIFVVAAVATVAVLAQRPVNYKATGSVFLSRLYPPAASTTDLAFEASEFEAAVALAGPIKSTAKRTGLSTSTIGTVQATEEGQGDVVDLVFVAAGKGKGARTIQVLTTVTATYLANQVVESANVAAASSSRQLAAASAALSRFNVSVSYADLGQANTNAVSAEQAAQAAVDASPSNASLRAKLSAAERRAATVTEQVNQQAQLQSAVTQASTNLTSAQQEQAQAAVEMKAASSGGLLIINDVTSTGRLSLLLKGVLGALVVVGLLGFVALGLLDGRNPRKRVGASSRNGAASPVTQVHASRNRSTDTGAGSSVPVVAGDTRASSPVQTSPGPRSVDPQGNGDFRRTAQQRVAPLDETNLDAWLRLPEELGESTRPERD